MKKGFTLVEIIGVVIVLGVMALIAFPIVNSSIKNGKEKAYNTQVGIFIDAAKKWAVKNVDLLPLEDTASINVGIDTLISSGFVGNNKDDEIKNPLDGTIMNGCVIITYTETYNQYTYEYSATCN